MIACALIPRLSLASALGEKRRELLVRPVALAPEPGGPQVIGEASGAAEAFGVRAGMRIGEALSRCPALALVAPDPVRADAVWERSLRALEAFGAEVEPSRPGEAFFATEPLLALCGAPPAVLSRPGGRSGGGAGRRRAEPAQRPGRGDADASPQAGAGALRPGRRPAARESPGRRPPGQLRDTRTTPTTPPGREAEEAACLDSLERLGVRTLGELAALPAAAIADRFGELGLRALRLARGADEPLRPRRPPVEIESRLGLPEAASGQLLEQALGLLVERLLAHPARAGRTIRKLRIEARLAAGGGWRCEAVLRSASASSERLLAALAPRLDELPGPPPGSAYGRSSWAGGRRAGRSPARPVTSGASG